MIRLQPRNSEVIMMAEAYRRSQLPNQKNRPLLERWVGLGTTAAYRPALKKGLLR
jgi:hypothetical protein